MREVLLLEQYNAIANILICPSLCMTKSSLFYYSAPHLKGPAARFALLLPYALKRGEPNYSGSPQTILKKCIYCLFFYVHSPKEVYSCPPLSSSTMVVFEM